MKNPFKVKDMPAEQTPTMGSHLSSGNPITELLELCDLVLDYNPMRCECDKETRCEQHRIKSIIDSKREALKTEIVRVFEAVEEEDDAE